LDLARGHLPAFRHVSQACRWIDHFT
jgi:hypothetical protein